MPVARFDSVQPLTAGSERPAAGAVHSAHPLPLGSHLALVTDLDGLAGLEPAWRRLERKAAAPYGVFQSFAWVRSWAATHAAEGGEAELSIVAGYRDDELAFLWPLMQVRCGPVRLLRWASEPLGQYGDVLVSPGECPKAWLAAATDLIGRLRSIDIVRLRHVRDDALAAPFLRERYRDSRFGERAPWLDLAVYAGEAAYEARYTSSQRKRRKKIRKALESAFGPLSFQLLEGGSDNDAAMREAIIEKCKWIDARGRHNRALCRESIVDFLKDLSRVPDRSVKLVTSRMTAGDTVLSWEIGLRYGTTHFSFITAHDTRFTDYSPARLHMDLSQRRALADGMTAFDLMLPYDQHKDSWSSGAMPVRDYHLPLSPLGQLYGGLYLELLRPGLRRIYYRLPPKVLRLLKPLLGQ
jgi:CelD/BcsL family acetyltransferase involved in cellulose biosynthesis